MKKQILSGIQPSGVLTLGNYLGALQNWVKIQDKYDCKFFIADLHAITVNQDPEILRKNIKSVIMQYIACGIEPEKNTIFIQSHVPEHAELGWILNCSAYMGELSRMTQFKDKSKKQENVKVGLFDYPVLMAADILLYDADYVPVGQDQKQHLEMTRNLAERFNNTYKKEVFKIPEALIPEKTAKIMSLQDPTKKMSKSDENKDGFISLLDTRDVIIKKVKKALTDSENIIKYSDGKPGIKNLMNIYSAITEKTYNQIEEEFKDVGYGNFKLAVANAIADTLEPIQKKYEELSKPENDEYIKEICKKGEIVAHKIAKKKLAEVYNTVGFIDKCYEMQ